MVPCAAVLLVSISIVWKHVTKRTMSGVNCNLLQTSSGPWHLQSIEVLEKPSGRLYYFPCPRWLDRASSIRVKLALGQKPAKFTPSPRVAPMEEEDWQALVPAAASAPAELPSKGVGGGYTVSCS